MGTWALGPWDNDTAQDFLDDVDAYGTDVVAAALRRCADVGSGVELDAETASVGWAACELVALSFGYGDFRECAGQVIEAAASLRASALDRKLAIRALEAIGAQETSELVFLWRESGEEAEFLSMLAQLRERLVAAADGRQKLPKVSKGDVLGFEDDAGRVVVHVVSAHEVGVYEGRYREDLSLDAFLSAASARRVPCEANALYWHATMLGQRPLPRELRGKKLYAEELGELCGYILWTAARGGSAHVEFDLAVAHERLDIHGREELLRIADGELPPCRVRSPRAREAAVREANAERWARVREFTTPGPFGDHEQLDLMLRTIEMVGVDA